MTQVRGFWGGQWARLSELEPRVPRYRGSHDKHGTPRMCTQGGGRRERSGALMLFKGIHPLGEVGALTLTTSFCPSWFLPSSPTGSRITQ